MSPLNLTTPGALRPLALLRNGLVGLHVCLLSLPLSAQEVPDAGKILQQQPRPPAAPAAAPAQVAPEVVVPEADAGPKVLVKGFRIQGAVLVREAELTELLQPLVGRELSLRQIQAAASQLTAYYISKGYLARVIVPPQDIQDGIVILQVIEGKRGALDVQSTDAKLDRSRIQRFIDRRVQSGEVFDLKQLNTALSILNEQPGVGVSSSLKPGQEDGTIDLLVNASAKPIQSTNFGANNHGSLATGEYQASLGITANNPSGNFDALSVFFNFSNGSYLGRGDYSLAVGDSGLRLGVNGSFMDYRLVQTSFLALQGRGSAYTLGGTASYPLARDADFNLTLTASADAKWLIDYTVAGQTGDRLVGIGSLGLNGYTLGKRSVFNFGTNLITGNSKQRNASALAADQASRQVEGSFAKLGYTLSHLYPLNANWSLNTSLRGQFANDNLDSSERMSLGGPTAIRAYPVGEASGDDAWLMNLNLARRVTDKMTGTLFLDAGGVKQNHTLWAGWNAGNPDLPNAYELAGAGVGVDWRIGSAALLSANIAAPLGNNPGRDANNLNSDGSATNHARGWLSLTAQF